MGRIRAGIVRERIAGVDLYQVVNREQLEHTKHVDAVGRVLAQRDGGEPQVPRMLRGILQTRAVGQRRAPDNCLQLVGFDKKGHLPCQAVGRHLREFENSKSRIRNSELV